MPRQEKRGPSFFGSGGPAVQPAILSAKDSVAIVGGAVILLWIVHRDHPVNKRGQHYAASASRGVRTSLAKAVDSAPAVALVLAVVLVDVCCTCILTILPEFAEASQRADLYNAVGIEESLAIEYAEDVSRGCLCALVVEQAMNLVAFGTSIFSSPWLVLDFIVLNVCVLEEALEASWLEKPRGVVHEKLAEHLGVEGFEDIRFDGIRLVMALRLVKLIAQIISDEAARQGPRPDAGKNRSLFDMILGRKVVSPPKPKPKPAPKPVEPTSPASPMKAMDDAGKAIEEAFKSVADDTAEMVRRTSVAFQMMGDSMSNGFANVFGLDTSDQALEKKFKELDIDQDGGSRLHLSAHPIHLSSPPPPAQPTRTRPR